MPNTRSQERNPSDKQRIKSWDDAIADAKQRLKEVEFALKVFEERKKNGEAWPGEQQEAHEGSADAVTR